MMVGPKPPPHYAAFDGMSWPIPSVRIEDIAYKMTHNPKELTRGDMLLAASVLDAYRELVNCSDKKRRSVIQGIRRHVTRSGP